MSVDAALDGWRGTEVYGCMKPASPPCSRAPARYGFSSAGCPYAVPPLTGDQRQDELARANHSDVTKTATKLFAVLQNVRSRRQCVRLSGEIAPSAHETRAVHVDQRIRHVQILGEELIEECLVR